MLFINNNINASNVQNINHNNNINPLQMENNNNNTLNSVQYLHLYLKLL